MQEVRGIITTDSIEIQGYYKPLHITVYRQKNETTETALVFPGYGYTVTMPILFYTIEALIEKGFNVISMDHNYSKDDVFRSKSQEEREDHLRTDIDALYLAAINNGLSDIGVLAGKSLGTRSIAHLIETHKELEQAKTILLTPILSDPSLTQIMKESQAKSLAVIGTADPFFDLEIIKTLQGKVGLKFYIIERANHGLQIEGELQKSLIVLQGVIQEISILLE